MKKNKPPTIVKIMLKKCVTIHDVFIQLSVKSVSKLSHFLRGCKQESTLIHGHLKNTQCELRKQNKKVMIYEMYEEFQNQLKKHSKNIIKTSTP